VSSVYVGFNTWVDPIILALPPREARQIVNELKLNSMRSMDDSELMAAILESET